MKDMRRLSTGGSEAGTRSLSRSLTGLTWEKDNNRGKKGEKDYQRAKTRHPKNSVSSLQIRSATGM